MAERVSPNPDGGIQTIYHTSMGELDYSIEVDDEAMMHFFTEGLCVKDKDALKIAVVFDPRYGSSMKGYSYLDGGEYFRGKFLVIDPVHSNVRGIPEGDDLDSVHERVAIVLSHEGWHAKELFQPLGFGMLSGTFHGTVSRPLMRKLGLSRIPSYELRAQQAERASSVLRLAREAITITHRHSS